jgi:hypothetical protein
VRFFVTAHCMRPCLAAKRRRSPLGERSDMGGGVIGALPLVCSSCVAIQLFRSLASMLCYLWTCTCALRRGGIVRFFVTAHCMRPCLAAKRRRSPLGERSDMGGGV